MTTAGKHWVVEANGTRSIPMTKASAERIAKRLREGKDGHAPMAAKVVALQSERSERGAPWA